MKPPIPIKLSAEKIKTSTPHWRIMAESEVRFVKDIMKKSIISIDATMTVKDAASMMSDADIGSIIITKENIPVGILTERDFVTRIVDKEKPLSTPLSEVMSKQLLVISPDKTVWEAAEIMRNSNIHKVVVQDGRKVIGIVTTTDLIKLFSVGSDSNLKRIADMIFSRNRK